MYNKQRLSLVSLLIKYLELEDSPKVEKNKEKVVLLFNFNALASQT